MQGPSTLNLPTRTPPNLSGPLRRLPASVASALASLSPSPCCQSCSGLSLVPRRRPRPRPPPLSWRRRMPPPRPHLSRSSLGLSHCAGVRSLAVALPESTSPDATTRHLSPLGSQPPTAPASAASPSISQSSPRRLRTRRISCGLQASALHSGAASPRQPPLTGASAWPRRRQRSRRSTTQAQTDRRYRTPRPRPGSPPSPGHRRRSRLRGRWPPPPTRRRASRPDDRIAAVA
jgi:hypothetical protein